MELKKQFFIKISGGCEAYQTGIISFKVKGKSVEVNLDNEGGWFYTEGVHVKSFVKIIELEKFVNFFNKVGDLIKRLGKTENITTSATLIQIYLQFEKGVINKKLDESRGDDVRHLIDLINKFIENINPAKVQEKIVKNLTDQEILKIAEKVCKENQWKWINPALSKSEERYFVITNSKKVGNNALIYINPKTGKVIEKRYKICKVLN